MALTGSHSNGNQRSVCVLVAKPAAILDSGQFFKINEVDVSVSLDIHSWCGAYFLGILGVDELYF